MNFFFVRYFRTYGIIIGIIFSIFSNSIYAYSYAQEFDFDKSSPPEPRVILGDSSSFDTFATGLMCLSETDPTYGACDTDLADPKYTPGKTDIKLLFTEQRSNAKVVITLSGYRQFNPVTSNVIKTKYNNSAEDWCLAVTSFKPDFCEQSHAVKESKKNTFKNIQDSEQAHFYLYFADSSALPPYGGIWKATLKFHALGYINSEYANDEGYITYNITLKMTDNGNIQMYLPNLSGSTPTVDLRLVSHPFAKPDATESGDASIESCLYDGYNSNSTKFTLEATNPDSSENGFFVTAKAAEKSNISDSTHIYYNVSASNPGDSSGATIPLTSGVPQTFTISNGAPFRLVTLPGITGNVACVPWTIHLQTPSFDQKDKQPGYYNGTLNILFTPSTDQ